MFSVLWTVSFICISILLLPSIWCPLLFQGGGNARDIELCLPVECQHIPETGIYTPTFACVNNIVFTVWRSIEHKSLLDINSVYSFWNSQFPPSQYFELYTRVISMLYSFLHVKIFVITCNYPRIAFIKKIFWWINENFFKRMKW